MVTVFDEDPGSMGSNPAANTWLKDRVCGHCATSAY